MSDRLMSSPNVNTVNVLKRRCEVLEQQLAVANTPRPKITTHDEIYAGRPIRRLVSFFNSPRDLFNENDRRLMLELESLEEGGDVDVPEHTIEQERLFRGYQELLIYVPSVKAVVDDDSKNFVEFLKNIAKGADMARGDDTASLKVAVVEWVHEIFGMSTQRLESKQKLGRGLDHDHCGKLLCPIEFDWSDLSVRAKIRDGDPDYAVTAHSWPQFVYAGFEAHANDMEKGLLRSNLLVKAYQHIFTSPTSVAENLANTDLTLAAKRRKTVHQSLSKKSNVATLVHLNKVTPRSIAYIAVQVRFALSSLNSWNEVDIDFNHQDFYNSIIDYFEITPGPVAQRNSAELLHWWNKKIFRKSNEKAKMAEAGPCSSVSRLSSQRAAKEKAVPLAVIEIDDSEALYE